jgi:hypothetical protein
MWRKHWAAEDFFFFFLSAVSVCIYESERGQQRNYFLCCQLERRGGSTGEVWVKLCRLLRQNLGLHSAAGEREEEEENEGFVDDGSWCFNRVFSPKKNLGGWGVTNIAFWMDNFFKMKYSGQFF